MMIFLLHCFIAVTIKLLFASDSWKWSFLLVMMLRFGQRELSVWKRGISSFQASNSSSRQLNKSVTEEGATDSRVI